jgi:hypothetical protein
MVVLPFLGLPSPFMDLAELLTSRDITNTERVVPIE